MEVIFLSLLILLAVIILKYNAEYIVGLFPECFFYKTTGYLCPSCGNTRSALALLDGNFILALKYNIVPPVIALLCIMLYIEMIAKCVGKTVRLIPRSYLFMGSLISLVTMYIILRNFLPFLTIAR